MKEKFDKETLKPKAIRNYKMPLLWIWQLPQHLIALFMCLVFRVKPTMTGLILSKTGFSFSLGEYIFVDKFTYNSIRNIEDYGWNVLVHESGHTIQSRCLGWLWLIIIGIPSALHWIWYQYYGKKHGANYYSFYTEKWADKLAGLKRD